MTYRTTSPLNSKLVSLSMLLFSGSLMAGDILFVSDHHNDENIATVLNGDGHNVTVVLNDYVDDSSEDNVVLQGDLSSHSCIVWAANGEGSGDDHNTTTTNNLAAWVRAGGRLFVTGYDTVASPPDEALLALVGGTGSSDTSSDNITGPVTGANMLSTGLINIVGVTPTGGYSDSDTLVGLEADTVCVASRPGTSPETPPRGCAWSLRTLGAGQIAYVSNGQSSGADHASWENTSAGGAGAYNAAVRNFAANCAGVTVQAYGNEKPVPTLSGWSVILLSGVLALFAGIMLRSRKTV